VCSVRGRRGGLGDSDAPRAEQAAAHRHRTAARVLQPARVSPRLRRVPHLQRRRRRRTASRFAEQQPVGLPPVRAREQAGHGPLHRVYPPAEALSAEWPSLEDFAPRECSPAARNLATHAERRGALPLHTISREPLSPTLHRHSVIRGSVYLPLKPVVLYRWFTRPLICYIQAPCALLRGADAGKA
jgi:hypothetical protein